mgnify:CR=1
MPRYDYLCGAHGVFEATVGRGVTSHPCPTCGNPATRELSVPFIAGGTVARSIPDQDYRHEADLRESRASGWDTDRAVREMRKTMREDSHGEKHVAIR